MGVEGGCAGAADCNYATGFTGFMQDLVLDLSSGAVYLTFKNGAGTGWICRVSAGGGV